MTCSARCFFAKVESVSLNRLEVTDVLLVADRKENVAGRWTRILLALRGQVPRNSSVTRRETKKIASTIEHAVIQVLIRERLACYQCYFSTLKHLNELSSMTKELAWTEGKESK